MDTLTNLDTYITKIHCVIKSTMHRGHIPPKHGGRHSDCIVFVISGTTRYNFNTDVITVKPGGVLYLSKHSVYSMDILSDEYEVIFTDFDFEHRNTPGIKSEFYCTRKTARLNSTFELLHNTWFKKKRDIINAVCRVYTTLYLILCRHKTAYIFQAESTL